MMWGETYNHLAERKILQFIEIVQFSMALDKGLLFQKPPRTNFGNHLMDHFAQTGRWPPSEKENGISQLGYKEYISEVTSLIQSHFRVQWLFSRPFLVKIDHISEVKQHTNRTLTI